MASVGPEVAMKALFSRVLLSMKVTPVRVPTKYLPPSASTATPEGLSPTAISRSSLSAAVSTMLKVPAWQWAASRRWRAESTARRSKRLGSAEIGMGVSACSTGAVGSAWAAENKQTERVSGSMGRILAFMETSTHGFAPLERAQDQRDDVNSEDDEGHGGQEDHQHRHRGKTQSEGPPAVTPLLLA